MDNDYRTDASDAITLARYRQLMEHRSRPLGDDHLCNDKARQLRAIQAVTVADPFDALYDVEGSREERRAAIARIIAERTGGTT